MGRGADIANLSSFASEGEKERLSRLVCKHYGEGNWAAPGIAAGVLPHYGDLQGSIRQAVEYDIAHGNAKCVACTSTLAEGVNLPIKYLVINGVRKGNTAPRTRDFQNLIGRTARSGKYSEGSVLIADDLSNRKDKAMYSHLIRETNMERCESAITNLLSDAFAHEGSGRGITGDSVVRTILENLLDPHLGPELAKALQDELGCDESKANMLVRQRLRPLEAIESYLSGYVATGVDEEGVYDLCASTYAYVSSGDEMRARLVDLFLAIYEALRSVGTEQAAMFHTMQVGIRAAASINEWVDSPEGKRFIEGRCLETELATKQFAITYPEIAGRFDGEQLSIIVDLWISGADLLSITETFNDGFDPQPPLKVEAIEKAVSGVVRFSFSHFISCVIDAAKQSGSLSLAEGMDALADFQRKVKYGVSSQREAAICEEVIDDRMIAREIMSIIGRDGPSDPDFMRFQALAKKEEFERYADSLPEYCAKRILSWIGE